MRGRVTLVIVGLLALTLPAGTSAQQWPNWRGPTASGVSPAANVPVTWSDSENVAWNASVRGLGISSPIVWSDRGIVTSQLGSGEARSGPRLVQNS